jgi:hypothetical protein
LQLRLKREQEARDKAEEERLISLMKKKFAEDETREREEAARRKKDKERVRPPTQTYMDIHGHTAAGPAVAGIC